MRRLHHNLTFQVLVAISLGILLGLISPETGRAMKPLGDTFINLVKMVIAPVIFLTIVLGIANMSDLRKVGRVGGKALLYFEIVTTFALAIGLIVVNVTRPGAGLDVSALAKGDVSKFTEQGKAMSFLDFATHIVPSSAVDAFAKGDVLSAAPNARRSAASRADDRRLSRRRSAIDRQGIRRRPSVTAASP